jgi:hypothetical protein
MMIAVVARSFRPGRVNRANNRPLDLPGRGKQSQVTVNISPNTKTAGLTSGRLLNACEALRRTTAIPDGTASYYFFMLFFFGAFFLAAAMELSC